MMSPSSHAALIHLSLDLVGGINAARSVLLSLSEFGEIESVSSVYKRYSTKESFDLGARLEFVCRYKTHMSADQTLHALLSLSSIDRGHHARIKLILLAFDNIVQMSPSLTLPYPLLHQDPLVIRCAAEAWGHYEHPIYQRNLRDISRGASPTNLVEFYMQGKSLVDF